MRLLLVEDDLKLGQAVEQGLRESGYAVDRVEDGRHGLNFALLEPYGLLVLDWMVPTLSGPCVSGKAPTAEGRL